MADENERSRARSRSRSRARGKVFRNPFLNFIQEYKKSLRSPLPYKEIMIKAGKAWRKLPADEKLRYIEQASRVPGRSRAIERSGSTTRRGSPGNSKSDDAVASKRYRNSDKEDDDDASTSTSDSEE